MKKTKTVFKPQSPATRINFSSGYLFYKVIDGLCSISLTDEIGPRATLRYLEQRFGTKYLFWDDTKRAITSKEYIDLFNREKQIKNN